MTTLFFIAEGPMMMKRMRRSASGDHLLVQRLTQFGQGVVRQFGLRGIVNAVTGVGVSIILLLLGVDFAILWGFLTFFLSYIPLYRHLFGGGSWGAAGLRGVWRSAGGAGDCRVCGGQPYGREYSFSSPDESGGSTCLLPWCLFPSPSGCGCWGGPGAF